MSDLSTGDFDVTEAGPRDAFLRDVIEELRHENIRWPGLWTRLESLMNERDALVAALEAAEDELRELASMTADDINAEVWKDKVAAESERNQQADRAARLLARAEAAEADLAAAMEALRELIACHDILNAGLVSFELHNETVERFEAAMAKGRALG